MSKMSLSYDNPVYAVFLRILAWELYVAGSQVRVKDISDNHFQAARHELGLATTQPHSVRVELQRMRGEKLNLISSSNELRERDWKDEWRLLYLPPHNFVRQLSYQPVLAKAEDNQIHKTDFEVTLRNPTVPRLHVLMGSGILPANSKFKGKRGVYLLRLNNEIYIGKSDEFEVRSAQHGKSKNPLWWIFVTLAEQDISLDTLNAAESLLISFWNEVAVIANDNRGSDRIPTFTDLQQAVLFSAAASAIWLWLLREDSEGKKLADELNIQSWFIPFKKWTGKGWPDCYIDQPIK